jgi:hypothetical protein
VKSWKVHSSLLSLRSPVKYVLVAAMGRADFSVFFLSFLCEGANMHPLFAPASGLTYEVIGASPFPLFAPVQKYPTNSLPFLCAVIGGPQSI